MSELLDNRNLVQVEGIEPTQHYAADLPFPC